MVGGRIQNVYNISLKHVILEKKFTQQINLAAKRYAELTVSPIILPLCQHLGSTSENMAWKHGNDKLHNNE